MTAADYVSGLLRVSDIVLLITYKQFPTQFNSLQCSFARICRCLTNLVQVGTR